MLGSFIAATIYRVEHGISLKGRSFCVHCKHTLSIVDLIPIISPVLNGFRCRYCNAKISTSYSYIEITCLLIAFINLVLISIIYSFPLEYMYDLTSPLYNQKYILEWIILTSFALLFLYITIVDIKLYKIYNHSMVVYFIFGIGYIYYTNENILISLIYFFITLVFFVIIAGISAKLKGKTALGGGDIKFIAISAFILSDLMLISNFFLFAGFFGLCYHLIQYVITRNNKIPFGPALVMSVFIMIILDIAQIKLNIVQEFLY